MVDFSIQPKPNKTETFFKTDRKRYIGMLGHVKKHSKSSGQRYNGQMQGIKLFLPLLMNPSTVTTCFRYQKLLDEKKNAFNEIKRTLTTKLSHLTNSDKPRAHGIVEKGMHLNWRFDAQYRNPTGR